MHIIVAGGTGFIGQALIKDWQSGQHQVTVISRDKSKVKSIFGPSVNAVDWQEFKSNAQQLLQQADVILNLCGANIGQKLWTKKRKKELIDSRIIPTTTIAHACAQLGEKAPRFFNASGVGIYGLQRPVEGGLPPAVDESTDLREQRHDFLSNLAKQWEGATFQAINAGCRVICLRFGVVLAKDGGALPQMARPYFMFMGGPIGSGLQPFPWISLRDLCGVVNFLIERTGTTGPVNCVAMQCVTQKEFSNTLAKILNRPNFLKLPAWLIKLLFGQMGKELLLSGQHVVPSRLVHMVYSFKDPNIEIALKNIYQKT